jgi:hypothetical protein
MAECAAIAWWPSLAQRGPFRAAGETNRRNLFEPSAGAIVLPGDGSNKTTAGPKTSDSDPPNACDVLAKKDAGTVNEVPKFLCKQP